MSNPLENRIVQQITKQAAKLAIELERAKLRIEQLENEAQFYDDYIRELKNELEELNFNIKQ